MLDVLDFIADRGGDPQKVRESQRRRFADENLVDEVITLYEDARSSEPCSLIALVLTRL
jgi:seryl-tRNA synthetase